MIAGFHSRCCIRKSWAQDNALHTTKLCIQYTLSTFFGCLTLSCNAHSTIFTTSRNRYTCANQKQQTAVYYSRLVLPRHSWCAWILIRSYRKNTTWRCSKQMIPLFVMFLHIFVYLSLGYKLNTWQPSSLDREISMLISCVFAFFWLDTLLFRI